MISHRKPALAAAIAVSLGLTLSACASDAEMNRSLYSVKQPVVERATYTLDLAAGAGGLPAQEQRRLEDWFAALDVRYGDSIALDGLGSDAVRQNMAALAGRRGLMLDETVPVPLGAVAPGHVRVVVSRARAHVPGCPDWGDRGSGNLDNRTSDNFGCAINGNLAAMVADPRHLLEGAKDAGETVVMSSNKAIDAYRQAPPTGTRELREVVTNED